MSKRTDTAPILLILGVGIALMQLIDIVIHAATSQLEFVRVASNIVILVWLAAAAAGKFNARAPRSAAVFIGAYLALNLIFLATSGVTNEGQLRIALLLLVFFTVAFSALLSYMLGQRGKV